MARARHAVGGSRRRVQLDRLDRVRRRWRWQGHGPDLRPQRGALAPMASILLIALFLLSGLVLDGGRQLANKSRAVGYAQEAARAGASALKLTEPEPVIDKQVAEQAVAEYCDRLRAVEADNFVECGPVAIDVNTVSAFVRLKIDTSLLGLLGVQTLYARGEGMARADQGITEASQKISVPATPSISIKNDPPPLNTNPKDVDPIVVCPTFTLTIGIPVPSFPGLPNPLPASCQPIATATPTPTPTG